MHLQLVVPDLFLDRDALDGEHAGALPRLAGLETLLRYAHSEPAPSDWRAFVAGRAGRGELAGCPPAAVVAAAVGIEAPERTWFASPVHLVAGLDHLRLHPAGLLRLADAVLRELAEAFNTAFADEGLRLHLAAPGLLLTGLAAIDADTQDPARFLGADVRAAPARGPDAGRLRRLGAEIEMWLHGRSAAFAEADRGLSVNALWLWGGGRQKRSLTTWRAPIAHSLSAYADDPYVSALWSLGGREAVRVPPGYPAIEAPSDGGGEERLVCVSALALRPGDAPLGRLEQDWVTPAIAALRTGRLRRLALYAGGRQFVLTRAATWRLWRRSRPWWEALAT